MEDNKEEEEKEEEEKGGEKEEGEGEEVVPSEMQEPSLCSDNPDLGMYKSKLNAFSHFSSHIKLDFSENISQVTKQIF